MAPNDMDGINDSAPAVTPKAAWEAPDICSLDAPEINGGDSPAEPEGNHLGISTFGTVGS